MKNIIDIVCSLDYRRECLLRKKKLNVLIYKNLILLNDKVITICYLYSKRHKMIFGYIKSPLIKNEKRNYLYKYETGYNNQELNIRLSGVNKVTTIKAENIKYIKVPIDLSGNKGKLYDIKIPRGISYVDSNNSILNEHIRVT